MIKRAKKMVATGYWTSNNFNRETKKKKKNMPKKICVFLAI